MLDGPRHPVWNQAVDVALLEDGVGTVLRLYEWSPPGVSIGYFQELPRQVPPGAIVVRRPTGGGAILHAGDLTFSWSGPREEGLFAGTVRAAYDRACRIVAAAYRACGWQAQAGRDREERSRAEEPFLCFERMSRHDLVVAGRKVAGMAQRRRGNRCLLHGTVALQAGGRRIEPGRMVQAILEEVGRAGWSLVESRLSQAEVARARELELLLADPSRKLPPGDPLRDLPPVG